MRKAIWIPLMFVASAIMTHAATTTYDLTATGQSWSTPTSTTLNYTQSGFNDATTSVANAIAAAKTWLTGQSSSTAYISFGTGTYVFACNPSNFASIDVSNVNVAGSGNQIVIEGQGWQPTDLGGGSLGGSPTNLMFQIYQPSDGSVPTTASYAIGGSKKNGVVSGVTFTNMHMGIFASLIGGSGTYVGMVTQGQVQSTGVGYARVLVPSGFPSVPEVFEEDNPACFVRPFTYDGSGIPHLVNGSPITNNPQKGWSSFTGPIGGTANLWELDGFNGKDPGYAVGTLLAIKSKHGGYAGYFKNANNITLDHLRFTDGAAAIWFWGTSNNISCTNCESDRGTAVGGAIPCLASNSNGYTVQDDVGSAQTGIVASGNNFVGLGDDSVALQASGSGTPTCSASVTNNVFTDDFARGINLSTQYDATVEQAGGVVTSGNTYIDCFSNPQLGGTGNLP